MWPPSAPVTQLSWLPSVAEPQQSLVVAQVEPSPPQVRTAEGSPQVPPLQVPPLQHSESLVQLAPNGWQAPTAVAHIARQWPVPSQEVPLQHGARPAPQLSLSPWQVQAPASQPRPPQQSLFAEQLWVLSAQHAPLLQVVPLQQSASAPQL